LENLYLVDRKTGDKTAIGEVFFFCCENAGSFKMPFTRNEKVFSKAVKNYLGVSVCIVGGVIAVLPRLVCGMEGSCSRFENDDFIAALFAVLP
jgi:hypothetical protein